VLYSMIRSTLLSLSFVVMGFALTGCETGYPIHVKDPQLVAQPDKVSMMLAEAADKASNALETLAAVEQKRTPAAQVPAIVGAPAELNRAVTLNWVGPVDQITKLLADKASYRFVTLGAVPATPVVVNINVTNKPVIEVLRSVGLQLGARADVYVDSAEKLVALTYAPTTGRGDVSMNSLAPVTQ
jgi:defect in organelle trafficking protein DotD